MFLARHDGDSFSRWEALNTLYLDALIDATKKARGGKTPTFGDNLVDLAGELARDTGLDAAYRALLLTMPGEADVAREIGSNIDPDSIHAARTALTSAIAEQNADAFAALHDKLASDGPYVPDAENSGRRALRNALLDYLSVASGEPDAAASQFAGAANMTDRAAALGILTHRFPDALETADALALFEQRYGDDPLVMDKWFQVQATIPGAATVARVRELMRHEKFKITNPNRVRALLGTFANANQTAFNSADGSGYRLYADMILTVEKDNPQVAARLATAFRSWRSLEPKRREMARETLAGIAGRKGLSRDLADIVGRTLA
jgi:aminopeptidase N